MAGAHFMVDGYGNIFAPLLPLLIPKLHLSLATAGALTMLFQMAASVAQVGFGHIADRWRPRLLVMWGPVVAVGVLSFVGLAPSVPALAAVLIVGGLGAAAFHPPAAALAHRLGGAHRGLAMSVHITGGTLGFSLGPLLFAPAAQHFGLEWTPLLAIPGLVVIAFFLTRVPPIPLHHDGVAGFGALRPYARPLGLLYLIVVLRTLTSLAFATFVPVMLTRRGLSVSEAGAIAAAYLFASGAGGFLGGPAADRFGPRRVIVLVAGPVDAVSARRAAPLGRVVHRGAGDRGLLPAVDAARQRRLRPGAGAGQRGHGLVADDGLRLGHGRTQRAHRRRDRGSLRHRAHAHRPGVHPARRRGGVDGTAGARAGRHRLPAGRSGGVRLAWYDSGLDAV